MSRFRDLQDLVEMTSELKLEMIIDEMQHVKMKKLKDGNYAANTGRGFSDNKQYLYEVLYNIQQIISE
jgi:hypothetical protein